MSDHFADDRETPRIPDDAPLREIVPDGFIERSAATTLRGAIREAEQAPSSTPHGELRRCPQCDSVKVYQKSGDLTTSQARSEPLKCGECGAHFDEAGDSKHDAGPGQQVTLSEGFLA